MNKMISSLKTAVLFAAILIVASGSARDASARTAENMVSTTVVINEVYGGAGCGTAACSTYQNDFIELKNISAGLVSITGYSVQYASATGAAWQVTPIPGNVVLRPGDTYLIAEAFGANGVSPLPTPNATGTIAMSSLAFKVALVSNTTALSGSCPVNAFIIDFVGNGTANCSETAPASSTTTTTSISRDAVGTDTDNNSLDFTVGTPTPQAALQPTPAGVSVGGRVTASNGRGLGKVMVTLSGGGLAEPLQALTGSFGYYQFDDLIVGSTYVVSVSSKQYSFGMASQVISLNDAISDLNFVSQP